MRLQAERSLLSISLSVLSGILLAREAWSQSAPSQSAPPPTRPAFLQPVAAAGLPQDKPQPADPALEQLPVPRPAAPPAAPLPTMPEDRKPVSSRTAKAGSEQLPYSIQLTPPGPQRLFGELQSEAALREQLRTEALSGARPRQIEFPADYPTEAGTPPTTPDTGLTMWVPPHYVCHKRLYFEQPWTERCGNHVGVLQPMVSTGIFFGDVIGFPLKLFFDRPLQRFECHSDGCSPYFHPELLLH
jgi:hypothetical protein